MMQTNNGMLGAVPGLQPSSPALAQLMSVLSQMHQPAAPQGDPSAQPQLQAPDAGAALKALNQNAPTMTPQQGASALSNVGQYLMGAPGQQLPWQTAAGQQPGAQLPWQQANPQGAWQPSMSAAGNIQSALSGLF